MKSTTYASHWAIFLCASALDFIGQQPPEWWQGGHCSAAYLTEERTAEGLEALLAGSNCPFVVAFFSASSPLAQTDSLALTEQRVAASFPSLLYVRVDADLLGIRAF